MFVGRVGKFALFYLINKNNPMEKDSFAALIAAAQNMRDAQKEYFRAAKKNSSDKKQALYVAQSKEAELEATLQAFTQNNNRYNIEQYLGGGGNFTQFVKLCRELMELQRKAFDALRIKDYSDPVIEQCRNFEKAFDAKLSEARNVLNPPIKQGNLFD